MNKKRHSPSIYIYIYIYRISINSIDATLTHIFHFSRNMHLILHTVLYIARFTAYLCLWYTFLFFISPSSSLARTIFRTLYPRSFKISLFSLLGGTFCCVSHFSESSQLIKHRIYVVLISCRVTSRLTRLSELRSRQRDAPLMGICAHHPKNELQSA